MSSNIFKYCLISFILFFSKLLISQSDLYYSGEFKIKKRLYYIDTLSLDSSLAKYDVTKFKHYLVFANLYDDTVNVTTIWRAKNLGQIAYNDVGLIYDSILHTYYDTVQRRLNNGIRFNYSGNVSVSGFTTSLVDTFPNIAYKYILPDTLNTANTLQIGLQNVTFCDNIELTMFDGQFRILFPFNRFVSSSETTITVPPEDLSTLEGNTITMTLSFIKNNYQLINGKRYKFERRFDVIRNMPLKK